MRMRRIRFAPAAVFFKSRNQDRFVAYDFFPNRLMHMQQQNRFQMMQKPPWSPFSSHSPS